MYIFIFNYANPGNTVTVKATKSDDNMANISEKTRILCRAWNVKSVDDEKPSGDAPTKIYFTTAGTYVRFPVGTTAEPQLAYWGWTDESKNKIFYYRDGFGEALPATLTVLTNTELILVDAGNRVLKMEPSN